VPTFKEEAAEIYAGVGAALAAADEAKLRQLTTPSCFATMAASLRERPAGQRHKWTTLDVATSVVQVRIGHNASLPERQFAQVTCSLDAKLVWTISDKKGARIGGLGSKDAPHQTLDWWVFERCIASPPEPPRWRLKERIALPKREEKGGPTVKDAEL
jgi:predicted lipid-binding transport protein (Tim44 family)